VTHTESSPWARANFNISILMLLLCVCLTGCSGHRVATIPGVEITDKPDVEAAGITKGLFVRITLISGQEVFGVIVNVGDDAITLDNPINYEYHEKVILFSEIELLEVKQPSSAESITLNVLTGASLAALVLFAVLAYSLRNLGST
jgi:hypothetical protein